MPRPKTFDPDLALARAMELFWIKGFERTTLSELEGHLSLGRVSLYGAFGDKKALFLKSLQKYRRDVAQPLLRELEEPDGLLAIGRFFARVTDAPPVIRQRGCLIVKTLMSGESNNSEIDQFLQDHLAYVERKFAAAVEHGIGCGTIAPQVKVRQAAALLTTLAHGTFALNHSEQGARLAKVAIRTALTNLASGRV